MKSGKTVVLYHRVVLTDDMWVAVEWASMGPGGFNEDPGLLVWAELSKFCLCLWNTVSVMTNWGHGCEHLHVTGGLQGRSCSLKPLSSQWEHCLLVPVWGLLGASYPIAPPLRPPPPQLNNHSPLLFASSSGKCTAWRRVCSGRSWGSWSSWISWGGSALCVFWERIPDAPDGGRVSSPCLHAGKYSHWESALISLSLTFCSGTKYHPLHYVWSIYTCPLPSPLYTHSQCLSQHPAWPLSSRRGPEFIEQLHCASHATSLTFNKT